jgi:hypothetical protein
VGVVLWGGISFYLLINIYIYIYIMYICVQYNVVILIFDMGFFFVANNNKTINILTKH